MRPSHLTRHMRSHDSSRDRLAVLCTECGRCFSRKDVLLRHYRTAHTMRHSMQSRVKIGRRKSCLRCVQKKLKCDRQNPCSSCNKSNSQCSFVEEAVDNDTLDNANEGHSTTGTSSTNDHLHAPTWPLEIGPGSGESFEIEDIPDRSALDMMVSAPFLTDGMHNTDVQQLPVQPCPGGDVLSKSLDLANSMLEIPAGPDIGLDVMDRLDCGLGDIDPNQFWRESPLQDTGYSNPFIFPDTTAANISHIDRSPVYDSISL